MPRARVLLVEDNEDDVELTLHAFAPRTKAEDIVVAKDAEAGMAYLFGESIFARADPDDLPALVILDLKLPGISGLEMLRRLRQNTRTRMITVVILSASNDESEIAEAYDLGANSFLSKPVDLQEFAKLVQVVGRYWLEVNTRPA